MQGLRHVVQVARALQREVSDDDVTAWAASLAYRFLLALFPFFVFLGAAGGIVSRWIGVESPAAEVLSRFGGALPADARSLLATQLDAVLGEQQPGLLSVGLLGAIWAASSGMGSTMSAMNHAYDVEETRPFWKRALLSVGLTLLTGTFFLLALSLAVAGEALGASIGLGDEWHVASLVVRFAVVSALLALAMTFLYWAAPNAKLPFKWLTPGAVLFVVTWIGGSLGFGWYVANFGSYQATYGALGGVVVLMIWLYVTAVMLLVGAELNALLARQMEPAAIEAPAPGSDARASDVRGVRDSAEVDQVGRTPSMPLLHGAVGAAVALTAVWKAAGVRR